MPKSKTQVHKEIDMINDNRSSYDTVVLSSLWAKHLRKQEEFRGKPVAEIIKTAMADIFTGKVEKKKILEIMKEKPARKSFDNKSRQNEGEKEKPKTIKVRANDKK